MHYKKYSDLQIFSHIFGTSFGRLCLHAIRHAVHRPAPLRWDSMFNPLADQESNGKDIGYHWMIMPISHGRSYGRPWNHDKSAVSPTFLSTTQQHEDHRGHSSRLP